MAYHGTKPGAVRRMLDRKELLFPGKCIETQVFKLWDIVFLKKLKFFV